MNLPAPQERPTLTVPEVAAVLGIGKQTVYEAIAAGRIDALRLSPRRIVVPTALVWRLVGLEPPT